MQVAVRRLGRVRGAEGLGGALRSMMLGGGLRTYVMDMGGGGLPRSRYPGITCAARHAGARGVYILECGGDGDGPGEFYLDRRAGRFCVLHTMAGGDTDVAVRLVARTTRLRRACVGPGALEAIAGDGAARNGGRAVPREAVRAERSAADGTASADVRWDGAVLSTGGTSVDAHLRLVGEVRAAYARMCSNIEGCRGRLPLMRDGRIRHVGRSVDFVLSKEIKDVPGLVGRMFDGAPPLLMSGSCRRIEGDNYAVPVADLENAEYLYINMSPRAFSVGIGSNRPGASVLRLLGHMQLRHDPGLTCPIASGAGCGQPHSPGQQGV